MASLDMGEATVKINFEMTDTSKAVVKGVVAEVLREAVEPFANEEALRVFVRAEVRKALADEVRNIRMHMRTKP